MRISDLKEEQIKIGLRVKSLKEGPDRWGTVVSTENIACDDYWWIQWDGDETIFSGFFYNDCDCEVLADETGNPIYVHELIMELAH